MSGEQLSTQDCPFGVPRSKLLDVNKPIIYLDPVYSPRLQSREYRELNLDDRQFQPVLRTRESQLHRPIKRHQLRLRHGSIVSNYTVGWVSSSDNHGAWRRNNIRHLSLDDKWKSKLWRLLGQHYADHTLHLVRSLRPTRALVIWQVSISTGSAEYIWVPICRSSSSLRPKPPKPSPLLSPSDSMRATPPLWTI